MYHLSISLSIITFYISTTLSLYCSSLVPHHSYDNILSDNQVNTRLSLSMRPGSTLCLQSGSGHVTLALTILETRVVYHIRESYNYTWPEVEVSCYCTCSPSQCKLPTCLLCYQLSHVSSPCPESITHSSTCCSVEVKINYLIY